MVRYAARELGVHIVDLNCYDLLGAIETQTENNLRNVFKSSSQYVPCILLLRNVHALEKTAQQSQPLKGMNVHRFI
jgi:peroxin-6